MNNTQQTIEELEKLTTSIYIATNKMVADDIVEIIQKAIALIKQQDAIAQKWVSVDAELPDDDRDVLIIDMTCTNDYSYPFEPTESRVLAFYSSSSGIWYYGANTGHDELKVDGITHWMELPQPPESRIYTDADIVGSDELQNLTQEMYDQESNDDL